MSPSILTGLRAKLHLAEPVYFSQTMFPDAGISSIIGSCGFDFVLLDAEHGPFTLASLRTCIEALSSVQTPAVVRTASHSDVEIKQVLDLGASGVIVPRVETAEQAKAVIRAARYAPEGARGVSAAVRAARFGLDRHYVAEANKHVAVMLIIESALGVGNAEEIAAVPGLDGIMTGADDLSADLGLFGQYTHPHVEGAIERVIAAAVSAGIKVGPRSPKTSEQRASTLVHCGNDAIVLRMAFEAALATQRT